MAFDNVIYTRKDVSIPSGLSWESVYQTTNIIVFTETLLNDTARVTNSDGSVTIYRGENLIFDVNGNPVSGDVDSIERWDASRTIRYEYYSLRLGNGGANEALTVVWPLGVGPLLRAGSDEYILNRTDLTPTEAAGAGIDSVSAETASFTLPANFENLTNINGGSAPFTGTGNALNNVLTGASGVDTLVGLDGDDTLDGDVGADVMTGGKGNDTYVVDDALDKVTELASQGIDKVTTSLASYTLGLNVEDLEFATVTDVTGTGNALNNSIVGTAGTDSLSGLGGNDRLDGGGADGFFDTLTGGTGNDTYVIHNQLDDIVELAGQGTDTIIVKGTFAGINLAILELANIENVSFADLSGNRSAIGNALNNTLIGGLDVDTFQGGIGNDTLDTGASGSAESFDGGVGNDIYIVRHDNNVGITDSAGIDTVQAFNVKNFASQQISLALMETVASVENLTLIGGATGEFSSAVGNALANTITGDDADNELDGKAGKDTLIGGKGDDEYDLFDDFLDVITEKANEGRDTVRTTATSYTLGANLEVLRYQGNSNFTGTGNTLDNEFFGNNQSLEHVKGLAGNDKFFYGVVDGKLDILEGGTGNDLYVVTEAETIIETATGGTDTVQAFQIGSFDLTTTANVENLEIHDYGVLTAFTGTGNALSNKLTGGAQDDTLSGGTGNDILDAGTAGTDSLTGGTGNDTYIIRHGGVTITENAGAAEGTADAIESYLASIDLSSSPQYDNIENLTLKGNIANSQAFGNALANIITGDDANNSLFGGNNDAKADTLKGGKGNDTYTVQAGDIVIEAANQGTDEVGTVLTTYTLGANVENLTFFVAATHNGTGNTLNNIMTGSGGLDTLKGLAGDDTLQGNVGVGDGSVDRLEGGTGNDTYILIFENEDVFEAANQGTDTVKYLAGAGGSYTLGANVENLEYFGVDDFTGTGNALNNSIIASSANVVKDQLFGLAGNDRLDAGGYAGVPGNEDEMTGGTGNDIYVVRTGGEVLVENVNEGTDTVEAFTQNFNLSNGSNIENLSMMGELGLTRTAEGNNSNNVINGSADVDEINGDDGADTLFGHANNDTLNGGGGKDTLDGGAGTDQLDGGDDGLADTLKGGDGNDFYTVYAGDVVSELAGAGSGTSDRVFTSLSSYTLTANVERLFFTGSNNHTGIGNALNNDMVGEAGQDTLSGLAGDDQLDGGGNDNVKDTLIGGVGNDRYTIDFDSATDTVVELANQGTDTVFVTNFAGNTYTLEANVENLVNSSSGSGVTGIGNVLANKMTGSAAADTFRGAAGNDTLIGNAGDDTLNGGTGNDALNGGLGNDTFEFLKGTSSTGPNDLAGGTDTILDFNGNGALAGDTLRIAGYGTALDDFTELQAAMTQLASGVSIQLDATTSIVLLGHKIGDLDASDVVFV